MRGSGSQTATAQSRWEMMGPWARVMHRGWDAKDFLMVWTWGLEKEENHDNFKSLGLSPWVNWGVFSQTVKTRVEAGVRRFKWDLSERPHSADVEQVLGYRAWSSGARLGLDLTNVEAVTIQIIRQVMRLGRIMERVKVKRRAPSLSSGLFQCLEGGVIRRLQQKRVRRKQPRGVLHVCIQGQRKPPGEGSDPAHQRWEGEEDGERREKSLDVATVWLGEKPGRKALQGVGVRQRRQQTQTMRPRDAAVKGSRQSGVKAR